MTDLVFSPQQDQAVSLIMDWYQNSSDKYFVLGGYAGTGKTTITKFIAQEIGNTIFCAFTGKAANVLREKDCWPAGTIHGFLYSLDGPDRGEVHALEKNIAAAIDAGNSALVDTLSDTLAHKRLDARRPRFSLNPRPEMIAADLAIVDEFSMLNDPLMMDLEKTCKRILYVGDPFQLPPISGECGLKPKFFLEEIHRQAMDNPIIRFSKDVREGKSFKFCDEGRFKYISQKSTTPQMFMDVDQIIVGRNDTRNAFNRRFRERKGFKDKYPQAGDKMICLKNHPEIGLFNGLIGQCMGARLDPAEKDVFNLDFESSYGLPVWTGDIDGRPDDWDGYSKRMRLMERFDYAYAITAHKSQGSEFDNVTIFNQPVGQGDARRRWLYTAITRGKNSVTLVEPGA